VKRRAFLQVVLGALGFAVAAPARSIEPPPAKVKTKLFPYAYIHRGGCGGVAFRYAHRPEFGELLHSRFAQTVDGQSIQPWSPRTCGTCGRSLHAVRSANVIFLGAA
jgi:hypothetical protein